MTGPLCDSVTRAIKAAHWLAPSDHAAVDLALTYAAQIDAALEDGDPYLVTKTLYLGPHLLNTLRALGCAPAERKSLDVTAEVKGKLGELRALRGAG